MGDNTPITVAMLKECVREAVGEAMAKWTEKIESLETEIVDLKEENEKLQAAVSKISTTCALKAIDADMYSRKWNLIVQGIEGVKGENEKITEKKVRDLAKKQLKLDDAENPQIMPFAACHRLSREKNAGIVIKFSNLNDKSAWLQNAKNLRDSPKGITLSPDIPQALKPLKSEILKQRKSLPPTERAQARIRYHKCWPYISLHHNDNIYRPQITLSDIVKKFYQPTEAGVYPCMPV